MNSHPYATLTPERVLDAVEAAGWRVDGRVFALNSYENRVFQIWLEDGTSVVAKFYRPERWSDAQLAEEHAFAAALAEQEIPLAAPFEIREPALQLDAAHPTIGRSTDEIGFRFAVFPRRGGRSPELDRDNVLEWIGRFLGRIHAVGRATAFVERPPLDPQTFGIASRDTLLASGMIPDELREAWSSIAALALDGVERAWNAAGAVARIRTHGDCHPGNILWTEPHPNSDEPGGPHFVDLDDCRTAPAVQDLWMLLSGDRESMAGQFAAVLRGYEQFSEFDDRERLLIEPLRTLRLMHYSAWIARRWDDPAFPAAFPWFNTQRYWQDRILELREQVAAMNEPPLN